MASLVRHLLQLPADDPQFARLAAAAVLVARDGRSGFGWSTEEMELLRHEVQSWEGAWRVFLAAGGPLEATAVEAAALHLAFREMEATPKLVFVSLEPPAFAMLALGAPLIHTRPTLQPSMCDCEEEAPAPSEPSKVAGQLSPESCTTTASSMCSWESMRPSLLSPNSPVADLTDVFKEWTVHDAKSLRSSVSPETAAANDALPAGVPRAPTYRADFALVKKLEVFMQEVEMEPALLEKEVAFRRTKIFEKRPVIRTRSTSRRSLYAVSGMLEKHSNYSGEMQYEKWPAAVQKGTPIPHPEELLLRIATALLGGSYSSRQDVEAAVSWLLTGGGVAGLSPIAEDALSTCLTSRQFGHGGASRVACLVGAMLARPQGAGQAPDQRLRSCSTSPAKPAASSAGIVF
ncbi:hypothetical protein AK812_SmicGene28056 [Symbiodinium microadriaticum]|uniref:Uncharacterized protein n=1 Tax=Symbiodinium microadriaticum TaxID=2951 RepID=A0A1Q9D5L0_SYMMI|nr:hypothetical protein AK812_SmicGene28056 [Symbiodinium microadriaticum]